MNLILGEIGNQIGFKTESKETESVFRGLLSDTAKDFKEEQIRSS